MPAKNCISSTLNSCTSQCIFHFLRYLGYFSAQAISTNPRICSNLLIQIAFPLRRSSLANYTIIDIMLSWIFLNREFYFSRRVVAFDRLSMYFSTFAGLSHVSSPPAPISALTFRTHSSKAWSSFKTMPFWESIISSLILL